MAQAVPTTQNQNVQLTKTFIIAFAAVMLAIPIVTVITASIVQAQFASLVHAQSIAPTAQTNTIGAGTVGCELPASEKQAVVEAQKAGKSAGLVSFKWLPFVNQVNKNSTSTSTSTTTNTSNVTIRDNGNTNVDNRYSGNSLSYSDSRRYTNISDNGNTNTTVNDNSNHSVNTTITDNGNTNNQTWNQNNNSVNNSGNTTNTDNSQTNVNTNVNVNSGNTVYNDNDLIDIL